MKKSVIFTTKTVFLACFTFFLFNQFVFAADAGCHTQNGCGTNESDIFNVNAYSEPSYAPSWTNVTTSSKVYGGQYIKFAVTEGNIYVWTTEGPEDYFSGTYSATCSSDSDCEDGKLSCIGGYCLLPFDTELTLLEGNTCSANSNFLAYSNQDGFRNQSSLEWKATFTGIVTLLVTNYEYQTATGSFVGCKKTPSTMNTTVKWQRSASEHCDTCDAPADYKKVVTNGTDEPAHAPSWTTVQSKDWIDLTDLSAENVAKIAAADANWIKPGSYLVFDVKESEIYRWSTCASVFYDTQLSLFKGEGTNGDCGQFLAYGDDSQVSYKVGETNYCPAGTKQTVLEWQANFTGKVTLLLNEYNCYQCYKRSVTGYNQWAHCFEVTETYKKDANGNVLIGADTFPVLADASTADNEKITMTYMYAFPIDWQRYDCNTCTAGSPVAKIADFATSSGWQDFATGGSQTLENGQYMTFSLKRGSKYLFKASKASSLITIKDGDSCNGKTLAQGKGQLTYFADAEATSTDKDPNKYPDIITVLVSNAECVAGSNTLTYLYYGTTGKVQDRYETSNVTGGKMYTDNTTALKFVDTGDWAATWKQAIEKCETYAVSSSSSIVPCPLPVCPSNNHTPVQGVDKYCKYNGDGSCSAPICDTGYKEYPKSSQTYIYSDSWGSCYFKPDLSAMDICYGVGLAKCFNLTPTSLEWNKTINCATKECIRKNNHIDMVTECPDGYTYNSSDGKCYGDGGEAYDIYLDPASSDVPDAQLQSVSSSNVSIEGLNGSSCPSGMQLIDGVCKYETCGQYAPVSFFITKNGVVYHKNPANGCYQTQSTSGALYPCCCDQPIYKFYGASIQTTYAASTMPYVDSEGDYHSAWTCTDTVPCQEGYLYGAHTNKCYKCNEEGFNYIFYTGYDYKCASCSPDEDLMCVDDDPGNGGEVVRKYITCEDGFVAVQDGGDWKCVACDASTTPVKISGNWKCERECAGTVQNNKCYTSVTNKVEKCPSGWIEDPQNSNLCRKLNGEYVHCAKSTAVLKDNNGIYDGVTFETCNVSKPNSVDCDCFYDRCETGFTDADRKVCPATYTYGGHSYPVTPKTDSDGFVTGCTFNDSTGTACGEAVGGWFLPNINQLYSIVDFDLYDPATALPFSGGGYVRDELCKDASGKGVPCSSSVTTPKDCTPSEADPFGDAQCGLNGENGDGHYICMDGKCVRNNWYWSSTTVVSENADDGKFIWSVNMQDGRSYRAVKGCVDAEDCAANPGLNARSHKVMCIKGSSISGIFDSDAPSNSQTFSGWTCNKSAETKKLQVYFEIIDSSSGGKDVVALLGDSDLIDLIPGFAHKGIKYGETDITPTTSYLPGKQAEIYNNCGYPQNPAPHAFEVKWNGEITAGKEAVANVIRSIQTKECSNDIINAVYEGQNVDTSNCAVPPYFVTAYAVDASESAASAVAISPTNRPFVFTNRCGDKYMTYDGSYTENCEADSFDKICAYGNSECQLCAQTDIGSVKACTLYSATPPDCMDGTLQSQFCDNGTISEGHAGSGMSCEYYDFIGTGIPGQTEDCDCNGGTYYLYTDENTFNCNTPLASKICPDYYTGTGTDHCYICSGCKREKVAKARCGDGILQKSSCPGDDPDCQEVPGANEECDDGNGSNTDGCTNECKFPKCGDGYIQTNMGEVCDSGEFNGYYATNCDGTNACPGCAGKECGKNGTDPLGPRCGDGFVQNVNDCPTKYNAEGYGFASVAECQQKLAGAAEVCDLAAGNGKPVTFADFIANSTDDVSFCVQEIDGVVYPVNAIHEKYGECVYLYKQYVSAHPGCASDCSAAIAPYCGDGTKDSNENCDLSLPTVNLINGKYLVAEKDSFNGKAYGYCKLDCSGTYKCNNNIRETSDCADKTEDNFCPSIGDGNILYVKGGIEQCDDGILNGSYGNCSEDCSGRAYCGNGNKVDATQLGDCIEKNEDGSCALREECDFGTQNQTIGNAYSVNKHGSCISEDEECTKGVDDWEGRICCKYGRYCGDGTVDNGEGLGLADSKEWLNASNWVVSAENAASVVSEPRELAVQFVLNGASATAELNIAMPIETLAGHPDKTLRYMIEYDIKAIKSADETVKISSGVNEYDESGILTGASSNASPYFVVNKDLEISDSNIWKHARTGSYVSGFAAGASYQWYTGTKFVKILLKMEGADGTEFYLRGLKFFALENGNPKSVGGASEMCDPGEDNFVEKGGENDSRKYMEQCQAGCLWTYYCGDDKIQRSENCNGYDSEKCEVVSGAEEVCDNGTNAHNVYNGCEPGCFELGPHCGDGIVDHLISCDGCNVPVSGLLKDEVCDRGVFNSILPLGADRVVDITNYNKETSANACRDNCMVPRCGDGILDAVVMYNSVSGQYETVEECDCGVAGSYYDSTKLQKTSITVSGEIKEIELCVKSDGTPLYNTNDGGRAAVCRPNCKISRCGDGILDPEEECDDGNFDDHDSCNKKCKKTKCGDDIFSYKRSYLCEELIGKNAVGLTDMAAKGVIDCCAPNDTNCTYGTTCASLLGGSEAVVSQNNVVDWFSTGILHCCYNMKLENNTVNDRNCEINFGSDSDPDWKTPRDIALENCTTYAYKEGANNAYSLMDEDECSAAGYLDSLEMCESCLDEDCGCSERYPDTTSPNYHKCIDQNRYCNKTCWNRIGECGDGRIDNGEEGSGTIDAGEVCDNHQKGDAGSYTDIYGRHPIPGGNKGIGSYCTGAWVGTGTPDSERPMCGGTVTTDCWSKGCSQKTHGGLDGSESKCGDGIVDVYAGEECDEKSGGDYETNWCSPDCKWNVKDGVTAGCGDGVVQENSNEVCDDGNDIDTDYCINNCHTYYGYCGDGKITGPGFNMYDTLVTLPAPNQAEGPEDCDPEDARTKSLVNAGITVTTMCSEEDCLKVATCGNNSRNPRFEGCDCWTSGNQGNHTCEYTFERTIGSDQIKTVCHNDCTADPVGQVFAFNPGKISGWACDPDHPMTHRTKAKGGMVKVEFFNKLNTELKNPDYTQLVETNEDVPVDKRNNVTVICGGGELHGWEMNPSSLGLDLSKGPYTIKVYALTLDKANAADSDDDPVEGDYSERNTLIGTKTNFITAMSCGDNVISNCSDILVTLADGTETTWKDGWICKDGDGNNGVDACANVTCAQPGCCHELQGTCASYGLTSGAVCVNEACDNGFANNSDAKECSSKCQITSCGDGLLQDQVTERTKEECDKNSPRPKVFCNGTAESGDYPAVGAIVTADIAGSTIGSEEATCVNNDSDDSKNCKWDRSACTITSPCPALSTVVGTWGGNYKSDKAAQYIRYVDNGSTYKRNWDSAAGKWQDQESLKYKTDANAVCKFECTDNLVWNTTSRKCEPREDLSLSCVACGDDFGVWKSSNPEASCISTAKTVSQTVTINTDGDVEISPAVVATEYNSDGGCGWTCNSSSQYHSSLKKCFEIAKYHPCSLKVGDDTLTDLSDTNYRWVKVLKECDDNGENCKVKLDGTSAELTIAQGIGSETTTGFNYDPLDADLVSYALNDTDNGAKNQLAQLDTAVAKRCFYTCADTNSEGKYLYWDPQTQTCLPATDRCGNGIIENEDCDTVADTVGNCVLTIGTDEKCDDGEDNGYYGKTSSGKSHCDLYCGSRTKCEDENPNDMTKCAFINDTYNGRIAGGSKYFCGDGIIQTASDDYLIQCANSGFSCELVNETNYPGSQLDADEKCESNSSKIVLCNLELGRASAPNPGDTTNGGYYGLDNVSCSNCSAITKSGNACGFCGDGMFQSSESCEYDTNGLVSFGSGIDGQALCNSSKMADLVQNASGNSSYGTGGSNYVYSGKIKEWTVPQSGVYEIEVHGAQGGNGYYIKKKGCNIFGNNCDSQGSIEATGVGCKGAKITARYKLTAGQKLRLLAGKRGGQRSSHGGTRYISGAGGGGSFVVLCNDSTCSSPTPLVIAGGGGGAYASNTPNCDPGQSGTSGTSTDQTTGGINGSDGGKYECYSKGGRGWSNHKSAFTGTVDANGEMDASGLYGEQAYNDNDCSALSGNDPHGGFGGGGSAYYEDSYGYAGGGGGYSGGGAGYEYMAYEYDPSYYDYTYVYHTKGGGGGGSYHDTSSSRFVNEGFAGTTGGAETTDGLIKINMVKYPACNANNCTLSTTDFVGCGNRLAKCIIPDNAALWTPANDPIEQTYTNNAWTPSNIGQYSETSTGTACAFKCLTGTYNNGKCATEKIAACTGKPVHAHWNTATIVNQTWNGISWIPSEVGSYNEEASPTECRYKCDNGYTYESSDCINQKTANCTGLPANALWNATNSTSQTITQHWTLATGWLQSTTGMYKEETNSDYCYFTCKENYTWNSLTSKCDSDSQPANCTGKPANSEWYSTHSDTKSITQTWTGTQWSPSNTAVDFINQYPFSSDFDNYCYYWCKEGFHRKGSECVSNTKNNQACSSKPATGAYWNTVDHITQTWTGNATETRWKNTADTQWTPSLTSVYNNSTTGTEDFCWFKCGANNEYSGNDTSCQYCGDSAKNGPEACDNGSNNSNDWASDTASRNCRTDCSGWAPYCGDGTKNGPEGCDNGSNNSNAWASSYAARNCKTDCSGDAPYCGDGEEYLSEEVCDFNKNYANAAGAQKLCASKLANGRTFYDPGAGKYPTCEGGCAVGNIQNAVPGVNCLFCGDGVLDGSNGEQCETGIDVCAGSTAYYHPSQTLAWGFESEDKPAWISEIENKMYRTNSNNTYSDIDSMKGWVIKSTLDAGGYLPSPAEGSFSMCSNNDKTNPKYSTVSSNPGYFRYTNSDLTLKFSLTKAGTLSFKYAGSSESNGQYDYFLLFVDKEITHTSETGDDNKATIKTSTQNESWVNFTLNLEAGSHTLVFRFRKDTSDTSETRADRYCIDDLSFTPDEIGPTTQTTNPSTASCNYDTCKISAGECYGRWCGDSHTDSSDGETCDEGAGNSDNWANSPSTKHCNASCSGLAPYCGDGNPDAGHEQCDEGANNSNDWANSPSTKHCNASCSGLAPYCGDGNPDAGYEQCDKGTANNSNAWAGSEAARNCKTDCSGWAPYCGDGQEYDISGGTEKCDSAMNYANAAGADTLCDRALGARNYYDPGTGKYPTCNSNCKGISNAVSGVNCLYCGDGVLDGSNGEQCETGIDVCAGSTAYYHPQGTLTLDFEDESWKNYVTSLSQTTWDRQTGNAHGGNYALCSSNTHSKTASLSFAITPTESGQICFWFKGESEYSGSTIYDKFTYIFNGTTIYNGVGGTTYKNYQQRCESVTAGTTYSFSFTFSKDGNDSTGTQGIDRFCIDDLTIPAAVAASQTNNPSTATCNTSTCQINSGECYGKWCGDGHTDSSDGESCDDGANNSDNWASSNVTKHCNASCSGLAPYCGDGNTDAGHESCDTGSSNSNNWANSAANKHCKADCSGWAPYCGDGIKQSNEACDDGNNNNGDYCSADCQTVTGSCGDGTKQGNEACDDGNTNGNDYCSADCQTVTGSCGDGTKQGNEACDDGNTNGNDYCSADCQTVTGSCGDGTKQGNEACDDGNTSNGDYCSADCQTVTGSCGDGTKQSNEACDDGNTSNGDYCSADCQTVTGYCGDGTKQSNEACDEGTGNTTYGGTEEHCNTTCSATAPYCGDETLQSASSGISGASETCDTNSYAHSYKTCYKNRSTASSSSLCGGDSCNSKTTYTYTVCKRQACTMSGNNACKETWSCNTYTNECSDTTETQQCDSGI